MGVKTLVTKIFGMQHPHDKVVEILTNFGHRGSLLDAPAGDGAISQRLKEAGFDVVAADINPQKFYINCDTNGWLLDEKRATHIKSIGVDRIQIEAVATENNIPLYAIVIKQSLIEAISVIRKDIAESIDKVSQRVNRIIDEKTKKGDKVLIVGVGNTFGVGQ
jgi:hypothetical protein